MGAEAGEGLGHAPGDVFAQCIGGFDGSRFSGQAPGVSHAFDPGMAIFGGGVAVIAVRPGRPERHLRPLTGVADGVLVVGADIVGVRVGVHDVDIGLVASSL